jgi:EmrB/QacA subfamily drug resistance transporter
VETAATGVGRTYGPWAVFTLLALVQFMVVLDGSIVVIALPSIQADLGFSPAGLAWIMDAYMLAFGGFLLLGGGAADRFGRRRLVFGGMVLFSLASLGCGLATEPWHLVASRVGQGLGAAIASPAALALVTGLFAEGATRNRALAIWGGMGGTAGAFGILAGGLFASAAWQWAFLINVPIGVVVLLLGRRMLAADRTSDTGRLDVLGAVTATGGMCLLIFAVIRASDHGWGSPNTLALLGVAVLLLGAFALRERLAAEPLVPTALFRLTNVIFGNLANALVGGLLFGGFFIGTLYLQQVRGFDPIPAALATLPMNIGLLVGSQFAPRALGRFGPSATLAGALVAQFAALVWWGLVLEPDTGLVLAFILPGFVWCTGLGASVVAAYVVCTGAVPGEIAGAASGLVTMSFQFGGATGVAMLTVIAESRTGTISGTADPASAGPDALASGHQYAMLTASALALVATVLALWSGRSRSTAAV